MAYGRKTGGRNFAPGFVSNPKGGRGMPKEVKEARTLSSYEFVKSASALVKMNRVQLQTVLSDPETSSLDLMIGGIIVRAITEQCHYRAEFILNRLLGKVAIQAELKINEENLNNGPNVNFVIGNNREKLIDTAIEKLALEAGESAVEVIPEEADKELINVPCNVVYD